ncbi:kinase-like domain-containing protein [Ephemerocybe angulata]|uniref:Kinase-like domain-containing protein n=1 Tax=Ephemerocybe angulata TaxID=980116 RepID=A0A8H6I2J1_9AGAR|nr:kinase-like domain-containing protein [Tulosesus angulatus]
MTQTSPLSTFQSLRLYQDFDLLGQIQHRGRCDIYHVVSKRGRLRNRAMALKEVHDNSGGPLIHQALHHPGVVSLYSIFEHEGTWIHVMEYCPGGSLADRLAESMLQVQELLSLFRGLANALVYLESNQIIHRDIEPSNILITSGQGFKLSNFREATYCTSAAKEPCRKLSFCTSPEIAAQEPQSCSADAWSLGCVLLAALIGPSAVEQLEQGSISINSIPPDDSDESIQELIIQLLQVKPSQRLSPSQALAHPWAQPKCGDHTAQRGGISTSSSSNRAKEDSILTNFPAECSPAGTGIGRPSISEIAKKKPGLTNTCRRPTGPPQSRRIVTDPLLSTVLELSNTIGSIRSQSESLHQDRLLQFFMKPSLSASTQSMKTQSSLVDGDEIPLSERTLCSPPPLQIDLSLLSPNSYRFSRGVITILPSRLFLIDCSQETRDPEAEVLLVDPKLRKVEIHAASSRSALEGSRTEHPKCVYAMNQLPAPYRTICEDALFHLEGLKERTPLLTQHLVNGKCMIMCNTPVPDIEVLLRFSADVSSTKTMLRIRLLRRTKHLELARRTSHDATSEWAKKVIPCSDAFPFLLDGGWDTLEDLEKRGLQVLDKFLPVCAAALEFGSHSLAVSAEATATAEPKEYDEATFDSDFTPNFVPDLASSFPPRPFTRATFCQ